MAKVDLNPNQESFCQLYIELGNASEAYRRAFPDSKMNSNSLAVEACNLKKEPNVSLRIQELRDMHKKMHNITMGSLIEELEQARQSALSPDLEKPQAAAAVSATMGKAKLLGLDKQIVDITTNGESINSQPFDLSGLNYEQLQFLDSIATQASKD